MKIMTEVNLDQRLRVEAARRGVPAATIINELLEEHLPAVRQTTAARDRSQKEISSK